jgi:hypothetical protein
LIVVDGFSLSQINIFSTIIFLQGEIYSRPNQSALRPYKHRESQVQNELKNIKNNVTQQLTKYCNRSPPKAMLDRYAELLEN